MILFIYSIDSVYWSFSIDWAGYTHVLYMHVCVHTWTCRCMLKLLFTKCHEHEKIEKNTWEGLQSGREEMMKL